MPQRLSIIVPTLNEQAGIAATLRALQGLRRGGHEIIVADGGSADRSVALARPWADRVVLSPAGRALQMNAGAALARGDILVFLHADTRLPARAELLIGEGLARSGKVWGRFDVRLSGRHSLLRVVETAMNWRSRLSGIATGDQAMFVSREVFARVGGFPPIPLMEDIALSRRLKTHGRPLCLRERVTTSSRRWEEKGMVRTILRMWRLRLAYFCGAAPARLKRHYDAP